MIPSPPNRPQPQPHGEDPWTVAVTRESAQIQPSSLLRASWGGCRRPQTRTSSYALLSCSGQECAHAPLPESSRARSPRPGSVSWLRLMGSSSLLGARKASSSPAQLPVSDGYSLARWRFTRSPASRSPRSASSLIAPALALTSSRPTTDNYSRILLLTAEPDPTTVRAMLSFCLGGAA